MENWINIKVKDLCNIGRGRVINQKEINERVGVYPVYSSQSQNNGEMGKIETYDFDGEFVTWTTDGAYAGTVFYREGKFNCTNVCGTLKAKNEQNLDLKFLAYLLSTESKKYVSYLGNPKLMNGVVSEISLSIPASKSEQTRIAQILSKADEAISQTEALIAKYQRIKMGLMQDLLTRGIDKNGNIRSKATHKFVVKNGMEVPVEWEVDNLEKYCNKIGDGVHSSVTFSIGESVPFLFVSCIKEGEILWKNTTQISEIEYERIGIKVNKNDDVVLYSVVGSYGNAVKVSGATKLAFQRHIAYMIPQKGILNANFLEVLLNSQYGKKQADFFAIGNAQKTITLGALKNYTIILPSIEEQEKVLQAIQKQEKIIKDCQNYLTKLQSLKKGLMQDLLSGKVRVKT